MISDVTVASVLLAAVPSILSSVLCHLLSSILPNRSVPVFASISPLAALAPLQKYGKAIQSVDVAVQMLSLKSLQHQLQQLTLGQRLFLRRLPRQLLQPLQQPTSPSISAPSPSTTARTAASACATTSTAAPRSTSTRTPAPAGPTSIDPLIIHSYILLTIIVFFIGNTLMSS